MSIRHKAMIISPSLAEGVAFARQKIVEYEAMRAESEDAIAVARDEIALRMDQQMALERELGEWRQAWADRPGSIGDANARLREIDVEIAADREAIAVARDRLADIVDGPDILDRKLAAYAERRAALEAEADQIEMRIADMRGFEMVTEDAAATTRLDEIASQLREIIDEIVPAIEASKAAYEAEIVELERFIPDRESVLTFHEARRRAISDEWDALLAWRSDARAAMNEIDAKIAMLQSLIDGELVRIGEHEARIAWIEPILVDLRRIVEESGGTLAS